MTHGACARWRGAVAVLLAVAAAVACVRSFPAVLRPARMLQPSALDGALRGSPTYAPFADTGLAVGFVLPVPLRVGNLERATMRAVPSTGLTPPALRPGSPPAALERDGLYAGLVDGSAAPRKVYFVDAVRDPRELLAEAPGAPPSRRLEGSLVTLREGLLATRVPFVPESTFVTFEVEGGAVTEVLVQVTLETRPPRRSPRRNVLHVID